MDMSGAAAVLEAIAAIAELGLPIDLIALVPTTENMPSGTAIKPGDVITQYNGKTVEVNNTDAEGRLILADALAYAVELGAERVVDIATLTGAVEIALGSTYAGLIANDDELAAAVTSAGEATGELLWRLPLHPEYKELMKGTVADLSNLGKKRKAGTITAASFLEEFVGETPWAHLDIAGTAWDIGREYVGNDANGFGVRLLVELARHSRLQASPPRIMQVAIPWASSLPLSAAVRFASDGGLLAAAVEDGRLAEDAAGVAGDRPHELRLQPERGVADSGRERRVDGAAERASRAGSRRSRRGRRRSGCSAPRRVRPRRSPSPPPARPAAAASSPRSAGGGIVPVTTAVMYSIPVIVAPAAAVGTGSCQTRVRVRELLRVGGGEGLRDLRRASPPAP